MTLGLSGQQGLHLEMGMSLGPLPMYICKTRQKVPAWRTLSVAGKLFPGCCVALSNPVLSRSFGFPFHTSSWGNSLDGARWPETRNKAAPASHKAWQEGRGHTRQPPLLRWSWTNKALSWQAGWNLRAGSAGGFGEEYVAWGEGLGRACTTLTGPGGCDKTGTEPFSGREIWPLANVNTLAELMHRTLIPSSSARWRYVWEKGRVCEWIPNTFQIPRKLRANFLLHGGNTRSRRDTTGGQNFSVLTRLRGEDVG